MIKQYYDPVTGVWLASCQEGTPCPFPGAVEVPPEAQTGGGEGMRWDGGAWVAYVPPPDSCTRLQGLLALGMERAVQIEQVILHLDEVYPNMPAELVWEIQTTYRNSQDWHRTHPFVDLMRAEFNMTPAERDDLMRLAVTL